MSNDYNGKKRSELPDSVFGIPQERKYPMPDEKHTRSAIKLFNHVDPKYEEQLAKAVIKNMKKYNIDGSVVGSNNRLRKYLPKDMIKECIEYVMMDYNIMRGAPFIPKRNSRIYGANYFFVTDGASSYSNGNGKYNPAAKEMRDHMDDWERNNGFNPDDDWTNNINNVSNYRLLNKSSIKEETRIEDNKLPKHIYHISYINHDGETFEPRTYDNDNVKNGMERKVKRVCFSDSITRALYSIFPNGAYDADFYVHVPNSDCKVYKTTSDDIYDADITHELWIKEPVQMKCIGKIHVNGVSDKTHTIDVDKDKAGYGKKKYHETRWNWVEKYEKDETLYESYISEDDDMNKIAKEIVKTIKPIVLTSKNKQQASRIGLTLKCEVESLNHNTICILILDGSQDKRDTKDARSILNNIKNKIENNYQQEMISKIILGDGDEGCLYLYINKQYMRKISESVVTEDVAVVLSLALFAIFYGGIAAAKIHQKIKPYLDERKYVYSISQKKPTVSDAYGYKNPKDAIIGEAKSYGIKNAEKGKLLYTNANSLKSKAFLYKFNKKKNIVILYEGTYEDLCKKYKVQLAKLDESKLADRSKIYNTTISKLKKEMLQYDIFKKGSFVKDNNEYIQFMNGMSNDVELYHADLHKLVKNPRSDEGIEYANKNIWGILDNIIKNINTTLPDGYKVSSDGGDWDDVSVDLSCSLSLSESSIQEYGTTGGTIVGSNQPDSVYIVNYMQNNAFSGHKEPKFGVCRKGMKDLHIVGGKYNRFHYVSDLDKFKEEASDIHVYRFKGKPKNEFFDIIEEMKDDNDLDLYKLITGREIKDRSEIQFDGDFIEEECFFDTIDAIKACTEAGLLEASTDLHPVPILTETVQGRPYNYYRDLNGVFIQHEITGLRSKSYETLDDIPEAEKDIVKRGYLV